MSNASRVGNEPKNTGTSDTSFGTSPESKAQIIDAETVASRDFGEPLNIYRLSPVAAPDDPRWQNAPTQGEVVVAARTAGDARIVAAGRELDFMDVDAAPADDVTTAHASAFRSEKLYTVIEIERGRTDVPRGVISGKIPVDTIKPVKE
jgi:hypothetical protein